MLAGERKRAILDAIISEGRAVVSSLSQRFSVTEETIRRDLGELEKRGLIVKIHGGAVPFDEGLPDLKAEIRETLNFVGKKAIAKVAATLIKNGDTLFFDASTTVFNLAMELKEYSNITIITNSLRIINELSNVEGIKIICLGGNLISANKSFTSNSLGEYIKNNFYADKCFISCAGVQGDGGMFEARDDEVDIKKAMIECSKNLILLCDKTKLGKDRLYKIKTLKERQTVITDAEKNNEIVNSLLKNGVSIEFVKIKKWGIVYERKFIWREYGK